MTTAKRVGGLVEVCIVGFGYCKGYWRHVKDCMVSFDYRKGFRRRIEVRMGRFHYRKACWRLVEVSIGWGSILTTLKCVGDLC